MARPEFYGEGNEQRRLDTKGRVSKKWLGRLRDDGGGTSAEDPRRDDTLRQTREKILKATRS